MHVHIPQSSSPPGRFCPPILIEGPGFRFAGSSLAPSLSLMFAALFRHLFAIRSFRGPFVIADMGAPPPFLCSYPRRGQENAEPIILAFRDERPLLFARHPGLEYCRNERLRRANIFTSPKGLGPSSWFFSYGMCPPRTHVGSTFYSQYNPPAYFLRPPPLKRGTNPSFSRYALTGFPPLVEMRDEMWRFFSPSVFAHSCFFAVIYRLYCSVTLLFSVEILLLALGPLHDFSCRFFMANVPPFEWIGPRVPSFLKEILEVSFPNNIVVVSAHSGGDMKQ